MGTTRFQQLGQIEGIAFSPDGMLLATVGLDGLFLRDWESGQELWRWPDGIRRSTASCLAFSADGKHLAWGCSDHRIRVIDLASRRVVLCLEGHRDWPSSLTFSPDGTLLASAGRTDRPIRVWDLATGRQISSLAGHDATVYAVAFSPDGSRLASCGHTGPDGAYDACVVLWETSTAKRVCRAEAPNGVNSLAFSPDGKDLLAAGFSGFITTLDVATGQPTAVPRRAGHSVVLAPDGKTALCVKHDFTILLWERATGKEIQSFQSPGDTILCLALSPDQRTIAAGTRHGRIMLWDRVSGNPYPSSSGHACDVLSTAFSPDGKLLASVGGDGTVRLWQTATGKHLRCLDLNRNQRFLDADELGDCGQRLTFSPSGKMLAALDFDRSINIWDPSTGEHILKLEGHTAKVSCLCFSPDGQILCSGDKSGTIRLWAPGSGRLLHELRCEVAGNRRWSGVSFLCFSSDAKLLAAGCSQTTILLWDMTTHSRLPAAFPGSTRFAAFLPDDSTLLAAGSVTNGATALRLLDSAGGKQLRAPWKTEQETISRATLSPNGRWLALTREEKPLVDLWELGMGKPIRTLSGHLGAVDSLAFSADGKLLATGSRDKTILLWDLTAPEGHDPKREAARLGSDQWETLWKDLGSDNPQVFYRAQSLLATAPENTVRLLRDRLRPAAPTNVKSISELISDLDADSFAAREQASRALLRLGPKAEAALQLARKGTTSAEVSRRLDGLLGALREYRPAP